MTPPVRSRHAAAPLAACLALLLSAAPPSVSAAPPAPAPQAAAEAPAARPPNSPAGKIGIVLALPPGTALGPEASRYLDELAAVTSEALGVSKNDVEVRAWDDAARAAESALTLDDCFILGSLGFYAAHRKTLGLRPLLSLRRKLGHQERYRVLVKKGRFTSLAELKGRTLAGTPLHELPAFLDQAVFKGTGMTSGDFRLEPVTRPLRELRKLESERRDAVLVDGAQFDSLQGMPLEKALEAVHVSAPVPSLGLMARGKRLDLDDKMTAAAQGLCAQSGGESLCAGFGIEGFGPIDSAAIEAFVRAAGF